MKLSQGSPLYILTGHRLKLKKYNISFSEDRFFLVDPDEMPHYHLGLHCLPKYPSRGFSVVF